MQSSKADYRVVNQRRSTQRESSTHGGKRNYEPVIMVVYGLSHRPDKLDSLSTQGLGIDRAYKQYPSSLLRITCRAQRR